MATGSFVICGLCGVPLSANHPREGKRKVGRTEGLAVEIGFSRGGWGHREDLVRFSDEVCGECFDSVMDKADELKDLIQQLKGDRGKVPNLRLGLGLGR